MRFFASLRMTAICKCKVGGRVGLRQSRNPTLPPNNNSLIVVSNEVRNLCKSPIQRMYQTPLFWNFSLKKWLFAVFAAKTKYSFSGLSFNYWNQEVQK